MIDFDELKKYILENPNEVLAIEESERQAINNSPKIKILLSKYLYEFWNERPIKSLTYLLYFSEEMLETLKFENIKQNLSIAITEVLKSNIIVRIDNNFNIVESEYTSINHDLLIDLSSKRNIVFYFGEDGIDTVVRGKIYPRINTFYDESDRIRYSKKYHISELDKCLKDYENFIKEPGNNEVFFASKILTEQIQPVNPPKNILKNKPENILRNNLLSFLRRNTQHDFSKENELNNQRELDLYTEVEGRKYLIEVKWLGQSIKDNDKEFTQRITDYSAREGVIQTLEYVKHLFEDMRYNIHCGYLCVFDARETKTTIDYKNYAFIPQELMSYYEKHFKKFDEIILDRN